jgi:hypothetical protein
MTHYTSLALTSRLRLIPSSAALMARARWTSGGIRTTNFPLNGLSEIGVGGDSPWLSISLAARLGLSLEFPGGNPKNIIFAAAQASL